MLLKDETSMGRRQKVKIPARLNRKLGRALHDYSMLTAEERVLVAVSGGVDSLVLAVVLQLWQRKAPIPFDLEFIHIDHQFSVPASSPALKISPQLSSFGITLRIEKELPLEQERNCFLCARNRRKQLFDIAAEEGFTRIALGHHRDDLLETFLLNAFYGGNISTMCPVQQLFHGTVLLIRPMIYLEKKEIIQLAALWGLNAVEEPCPFADDSRRERVHRLLAELAAEDPAVKQSLFAALFNVRHEYLP